MRYRFIDTVVCIDDGPPPRIDVRKTFPAGDDAFSGPLGTGIVPNTLVLELLAMTGGELIWRRLGGKRLPLLIKARNVEFDAVAVADEPLRAHARMIGSANMTDPVATVETEGEVHSAAGRVAAARLLYACVELSRIGLAGSRIVR